MKFNGQQTKFLKEQHLVEKSMSLGQILKGLVIMNTPQKNVIWNMKTRYPLVEKKIKVKVTKLCYGEKGLITRN